MPPLTARNALDERAQPLPRQGAAGVEVVVDEAGVVTLVRPGLHRLIFGADDGSRPQPFVERHAPLVDGEPLPVREQRLLVGRHVHQQAGVAPLDQEFLRRLVERGAVAAAGALRVADDVVEVGEPQLGKQEGQGKADDTALGGLGHQQHRLEIEFAAEAEHFRDLFRVLGIVRERRLVHAQDLGDDQLILGADGGMDAADTEHGPF
jgi:hypothetical protein